MWWRRGRGRRKKGEGEKRVVGVGGGYVNIYISLRIPPSIPFYTPPLIIS